MSGTGSTTRPQVAITFKDWGVPFTGTPWFSQGPVFTEGQAGAVALDPSLSLVTATPGAFKGATLMITASGDGEPFADIVNLHRSDSFITADGRILSGQVEIGRVLVSGTRTTAEYSPQYGSEVLLSVQFSNTTFVDDVEFARVLEHLTYRNTSIDPDTSRNLRIELTHPDKNYVWKHPNGSDFAAPPQLRVSVTPVNTVPVITSGDAVRVSENIDITTVLHQATVTDNDDALHTWKLYGDDAPFFYINDRDGRVYFLSSPDFERPTDKNFDNVYEFEIGVTDGVDAVRRPFTVTVSNVIDEARLINFQGKVFEENTVNGQFLAIDSSVDLEAAASQLSGGRLVVSGMLAEDRIGLVNSGFIADPFKIDGQTVSYRGAVIGTIVGDVNSKPFAINLAHGVTREAVEVLIERLSYNNLSDNPTLDRTLKLEIFDAHGSTLLAPGAGDFVVRVNPNGEALALKNPLPSTIQTAENSTGPLLVVELSARFEDPNNVSWAIVGPDAAFFTLRSTPVDSRVRSIEFVTPPDFEDRGGPGVPSIYNFNVLVSYFGDTSVSGNVAVNVTNVIEAPSLTGLPSEVTFLENDINAGPRLVLTGDPVFRADTPLTGGRLIVSGLQTGDRATFLHGGSGFDEIGIAGNTIYFRGREMGTFRAGNGDSAGDALEATFNNDPSVVTPQAVDALIQRIAYQNVSNAPPDYAVLAINVIDANGTGLNSRSSTIRVNITPQNDGPQLTSPNSVSFAENSSGIAYQAMATDPEGQAITFGLSGTDSTFFTMDKAAGAVRFKEVPNYEGRASSSYAIIITATDSLGARTETGVTINVANVEEQSSLTGVRANATFLENTVNTTPQRLYVDGVAFTTNAGLNGAKLVVSGLLSEDRVAVSNVGGVVASSNGVITFNGVQVGTAAGGVGGNFVVTFGAATTPAAVKAVAESLTYQNPSDAPTATRTLTIDFVDNDARPLLTVPQIAVTVTPENDAPRITATATQSFAENGDGVAFQATATDPEASALTWTINGRDAALFGITNPAVGSVFFLNPPDFEDPRTSNQLNNYFFNIRATDAEGGFTERLAQVAVADVDEGPSLIGFASDVQFLENAVNSAPARGQPNPSPAFLDADVRFTSAFPLATASAKGRLEVSGLESQDRISVVHQGVLQGQLGFSATTGKVSYGGTEIGVVRAGTPGTFIVDFNEAATAAAVDALIQRLAYTNISDTPAATRTLTLKVFDAANAAPGATAPVAKPIIVKVTEENDAPVVTSASFSVPFVENDTGIAFRAVASDPDGNAVTWSLSDDDAGHFDITRDASGDGLVRFKAPPNWETPTDVGGDRNYTFQVIASDGRGGITSQAVTITVQNVLENEERPELRDLSGSVGFGEESVNAGPQQLDPSVTLRPNGNLAGGRLEVSGLLPEDRVSILPSSDPSSISVSGSAISFNGKVIGTANGGVGGPFTVQLTQAATQPAVKALIEQLAYANDSNSPVPDRVLLINVFNNDDKGLRDGPSSIQVTVFRENEAPVVTSPGTVSFAENGTDVVFRATATDPDSASEKRQWSLLDGSDARFFQINSSTGDVTFVDRPNFERPAHGRSPGNPYGITISVDDRDGGRTEKSVAITVTNVGETSSLTGVRASATFLENTVNTTPQLLDVGGVTFTSNAGLNGAKLVVSGLLSEDRVAVSSVGGLVASINGEITFNGVQVGTATGGAGGNFVVTFGAATTPAAVKAVAESLTYQNVSDAPTATRALTIDFVDNDGVGLASKPQVTVAVTPENDAPRVIVPEQTRFEEFGTDIVFRAVAVDEGLPAQTISWRLEGPDAETFLIDAGGNVRFAKAPRFGTDNDYDIIVRANDGVTDSAPVTAKITVTDEQNPPALEGLLTERTFNENAVNGAPVQLAPDAVFTAQTLLSPGRLVVSGLLMEDQISVLPSAGSPIGVSGSFITFNGVVVGTFAGGTGNDFIVNLSGGANPTSVTELIRSLRYANTSDAPTVTRTLSIDVIDAGGVGLPDGGFEGLVQLTGSANPLRDIDVGRGSKPVFVDLDGDLDLDLVSGEYGGTLRAWRNTGSVSAPVFSELTGSANPFNSIDVGLLSAPAFANIVGDGNQDLVLGTGIGGIIVYQNDGGAYTARSGSPPLFGLPFDTFLTPVFVDFDGDGDLDLVSGRFTGDLAFTSDFLAWRNTGTPAAPQFTLLTGSANPFNGLRVEQFSSAPAFVDLDGDGDLDLVSGNWGDTLEVWRNTGTALAPVFTALSGTDNPFHLFDLSNGTEAPTPDGQRSLSYGRPTFVDLDGDGDLDLVVGLDNGTLRVGQNNARLGIPPKIKVTVNRENDAPVVTDPGPVMFNENGTGTVFLAAARDPDDTTPTWSISDSLDSAFFAINGMTGAVTFKQAPSHERRADGSPGHVYRIEVVASDGTLSGKQTVTITVADVPEQSSLNGLNAAVTFLENTVNATPALLDADVTFTSTAVLAGGRLVVSGLTAADQISILNQGGAPGQIGVNQVTSTISFGGVQIGTFDGTRSGEFVVNFVHGVTPAAVEALIERLAYRNTDDRASARTLTIDVIDSDGVSVQTLGGPLPQITVTVTEQNDAPEIQSPGPLMVIENDTAFAYRPAGVDRDNDPLTWTLGGTDATRFTIDAATGVVRFVAAPNFELPTDASGDKIYNITVAANDGRGGTATQAVEITLTDLVAEQSSLTGLRTDVTFSENSVNVTPARLDEDVAFTTNAGLVGGRLEVSCLVEQDRVSIETGGPIAFANNQVRFNGVLIGDASGGTAGTFTVTFTRDVTAAAVDALIERLTFANTSDTPAPTRTLTINVIDNDGRSLSTVPQITVTVTAQDDAPRITSGDRAFIAEHADRIAYQASAIDPDGDTVTWELLDSPDEDYFVINRDTGAVRFRDTPDFERPLGGDNVYDLIVKATGKATGTAVTKAVTITVTDEVDAPILAGLAPVKSFAENEVKPASALLDADVQLTSLGLLGGGRLVVSGLLAEDRISILPSGDGRIGVVGSDISFNGTHIGTFIGGDGRDFSVSLRDDASVAAVEALIERLAYANAGDLPTATRTLTIDVIDRAGLGLGDGQVGEFVRLTGSANPFEGVGGGTFVDLDNDRDLDLVQVQFDGLTAWRNAGTASAPRFTALIGDENPFDRIVVRYANSPAFVDLDSDGDRDFVLVDGDGFLSAWRNDGSAAAPSFTPLAGADNPFEGIGAGRIYSTSFADLDNDGDLDFVASQLGDFAPLLAWRNTGSAFSPAFTAWTGTDNPLSGYAFGQGGPTYDLTLSRREVPYFTDFDGDFDLDLVIMGRDFTEFRNTGPAGAPVFVYAGWRFVDLPNGESILTQGPFGSIVSNFSASAAAFADFDGDGDIDVLRATGNSGWEAWQNTPAPTSIVVNVTPANRAPEIISDLAVRFVENGTGIAYEARATDLNGDVPRYTLDVADMALFTIDAATGAVRFRNAPDFEAPANGDPNNVYKITVAASDGNLSGTPLAVTITVTDVPEPLFLRGTPGNDSLRGGSGADTLDGAPGADTLAGGVGNDVYVVDNAGDVLIEATDGGAETVQSSIDFALGENFEALHLTAAARGVGNAGANSIRGSAFGDTLEGGDGDDMLEGGDGDDTLDGGAGTDTAAFSAAQGSYRFGLRDGVMIIGGPDGTDQMTNVELLKFGAAAAVSIASLQGGGSVAGLVYARFGNGEAGFFLPDVYTGPVPGLVNQQLGSGANDIVLGAAAADFLNGMAGDDAIDGGAGNDVIDGGLGSNFLTGGAGLDIFFVDGRGAASANTWSTITDYLAGEQVTIWGYKPAISQFVWVENDGVGAYKGATMHWDLDGNGLVDTSVTFTGLTHAQLPTPTFGTAAGQDFILFG